jgi:hypothetical protein
MKLRSWKAAVVAVVTAASIVSVIVPAAAQDKPEDIKKVMAEIAGDWSFAMGDQTVTVAFFVQDDRLFGAPQGENPEELKPVKDQPLCFDVTVTNGQYYFLKFARNEKGAIDKCSMTFQGMEIPGVKIIK